METYRKYGIRIPKGWKVVDWSPVYTSCTNHTTRTIHLLEKEDCDAVAPSDSVLIHELAHARLANRGKTLKEIFGEKNVSA